MSSRATISPQREPLTAAPTRLRAVVAALGSLTLLGFVLLRLLGIHQSLFGDEIYTYDIVSSHGLTGVVTAVHDTSITPVLHYLLAWSAVQLGDATTTVRLPSLILGSAAIPLVYLLGRRTVGTAGAAVG